MYSADKVDDAAITARLPQPSGYRLLIAIPEVSEKTPGGVYVPDALKAAEETASLVGYVVRVGPEAYTGEKFPNGPWCKEGDFILFRSYSGTRFRVLGKEFRIINDDTVEAVVEDPRGYSRA
jgi:chaperonin GroES